jgi:hypothetical protein
MNPTATLAVGKGVVVCCSTKNLQTTDGTSNNHSTLVDSKGNTWTKHGEYTETAGAAADGTTVSIWSATITVAILTSDTITLTCSAAISNKIITATEVTMATGSRLAFQVLGVGQNAIAATVAGMPSREYFLISSFGAEGTDNAKTPDADYTEQFDLRSQNVAGATTIHVQTRIATLTGDTCTSSAWTNTDPMALLGVFYEEFGLSLSHISSGASQFAPTLSLSQNLTLSHISSGAALYAGSVLGSTVVTRYVNRESAGGDGTTDATAGGTAAYATLAAAIAAELIARPNFVTNNEVLRILCRGTAADTTPVNISGFTLSAACYLEIVGNDAVANGRHAGVWDTSKYRLTQAPSSSTTIIAINDNFVRISGIQIYFDRAGLSGDGDVIRGIAGSLDGDHDIRINSCLIWVNELEEEEGDVAPDADPVVLDDFATARLNGDVWAGGGTTPLWYPNAGYDTPTVSANVLHAGLGTPVGGGAGQHQLWYRCNDDTGSFGWRFIRTSRKSGTFNNAQINRMRFHIKAPAGYDGGSPSTLGFTNCHIGTYLHNFNSDDNTGMSGSDDENMHFYHFLNLPGGKWVEVILDSFPDHQRGADGSDEHGNWDFTQDPGHTYHAQMTAFYIDYLAACSASDETLIKNLTMVSELGFDEPTWRQVRSPQYWFTPEDNTIHCGWNRRKDQPGHEYTIRWAHSPFASFSGGNLVGTIAAPESADFNTVFTEFSNGALAGHQWAWVAVQPAGASSFRQWAVPLELNA